MMKFILLSLLCFGAFANVLISESKGIYTAKINGDYEVRSFLKALRQRTWSAYDQSLVIDCNSTDQCFVIIDATKGNYASYVEVNRDEVKLVLSRNNYIYEFYNELNLEEYTSFFGHTKKRYRTSDRVVDLIASKAGYSGSGYSLSVRFNL